MLIIPTNHQHGASLIEFMIAMTISLVAIAMITSIYISGLIIDGKNIKFARLRQEVSAITTLIIRDIKRAGYVSNAHINFSGSLNGCNALATCSLSIFRTVVTDSRNSDEPADSCIIYAYDEDNSGDNNNNNAMGYRLHDGAIEVRVASRLCGAGRWTDITDTNFIQIANLQFIVQQPGRDSACSRVDTTLTCLTASGSKENLSLLFSFNATLVENDCSPNQDPADPDCITLSVTEMVYLPNANYN